MLQCYQNWSHTFSEWAGDYSEWLSISGHVALLTFLFGTISVAAYDFMCPNLRTLSSRSGLSANIVGVVFVAFGNSSVDIFGAIAALSVGANALAIGELIGAALFITTVVVGSMALFGPFEVESRFFKRDSRFLLLASVVVMYIVYDGIITLVEVFSLLALYAVYAIVIAMDHFDNTKNQEDLYADVARNIGIYHYESQNDGSIPPSPLPPRGSLLGAHQFHDAVNDGLSPISSRSRSPRQDSLALQVPLDVPTPTSPKGQSKNVLPPCDLLQDLEGSERPLLPSLTIEPPGEEIDQVPRVHEDDPPQPSTMHFIFLHLFPLFEDISEKHWLARIHGFILLLPIFCLAASVPVVGEREVPNAALIILAMGCPAALWLLLDNFYLSLITSILVVVALYIGWLRPQSLAMTLLGFVMSVVWVVNLAQLVINELQIVGKSLGISETFMGLTVFAIGDSLGDLVTNISIAQLGMSTMAVSACFASPFMTMLIGIGLGSLVHMVMTRRTVVEMPVDPQIFVSPSNTITGISHHSSAESSSVCGY
ncbi:Sodium/potassium/calcium exchanger 6, mitochondrial [Wickerhamiella sorbophila]|uniref:Sodium/potassium/calcium exchanger 6, mitochondrial n=1 Tax=Wickerhamiella sorbophila TaxID=45607 RepID=A0A2T0FF29_9ASCO|nr:Sodium/potassium/calcium exchanger 6, mitochondrial [Wickerhamiella sorbophila]PRT53567.1 Sodium/potassium/calcium exchanger 6, mitochondrial [Wickerhamiella sorbophila]